MTAINTKGILWNIMHPKNWGVKKRMWRIQIYDRRTPVVIVCVDDVLRARVIKYITSKFIRHGHSSKELILRQDLSLKGTCLVSIFIYLYHKSLNILIVLFRKFFKSVIIAAEGSYSSLKILIFSKQTLCIYSKS